METLQTAGVPAGACQTAEDRIDKDPQLKHLQWMTEVTGTKIGTWPIPELPVRMSGSTATVAGSINRGAPIYGEDNTGMSTAICWGCPTTRSRRSPLTG